MRRKNMGPLFHGDTEGWLHIPLVEQMELMGRREYLSGNAVLGSKDNN